ncbi:MAG: alpha/beta fold hydrolase [Saprospiraceae bacterium]|jgi:haloalkane dehalogenase|nr:alpha/beta fold hydrolase [Saprospiraceae bacterium]
MENSWVNRDLYPFESRFLEIDGHQIHYLDEGSGVPILFSHGTPEWSFGYRDVVRHMRGQFRCIAPDLLGFGLSDKPADADYSVAAHARRMEQFIEKLGLRDFHMVANDFGLSIAFQYVLRHPENVQRISLFNGWMWPLDTDPHYARPARWMRTWLGRLLYLRFNFPVTVVTPAAFGDKKKLTPETHRHYKLALPDPESRRAAYVFSAELLYATGFWAEQWRQIGTLAQKPCLIFWGMKDSFVPPYELERWQKALPEAQVMRFENAGHFVQEEEPEKMAEALRVFFGA